MRLNENAIVKLIQKLMAKTIYDRYTCNPIHLYLEVSFIKPNKTYC